MKEKLGEQTPDSTFAVFVPYSRDNPYQAELIKRLAKYGVRVETERDVKNAFAKIMRRQIRPDVLHLHWIVISMRSNPVRCLIRTIAFVTRLFILRIKGVRIVWTVHNLVSHECKRPKLEWFARSITVRLAHSLIVHTESAKANVLAAWHLRNSKKVSIVPHGNYVEYYPNRVDRKSARAQLDIPKWEIVMLFVGNIRPYKGVPELIEAFKKLNSPKARLVIAGKPHNDNIANEIRAKCGTQKDIRLVFEVIPDNELQIYMNAADIVVLPYRDILTSGAVILAMSFGKALIVPAVGCMTDVLDTRGSILYNSSEQDGLLNGLRQALNANFEEMGRHNLKLAKQLCWDKAAKDTAILYQKSANRKSSRSLVIQEPIYKCN